MQTNIELPSLKRFNNHAEILQLRLEVPMVWMHKIKFYYIWNIDIQYTDLKVQQTNITDRYNSFREHVLT